MEASKAKRSGGPAVHGALDLPAVTVESYNLEIKDGDAFIGDHVSGRAFRAQLDEARRAIAKHGKDPLGDEPSIALSKKTLDKMVTEGDPKAASIIIGTISEFGENLAHVVRRFRRRKDWRKVTAIVVGGGLRQSRVGELIIGRAAMILQSEGEPVDLMPIAQHPDKAGLIGAVQLAPRWMFEGFDSILAVDVGGSNIRCGLVTLNRKKAADLSEAKVHHLELWRHANDDPSRDEAVDRMIAMLKSLIKLAEREKQKLAPVIGIGCPGVITPEGRIERGGQNLPGNWEAGRFNLPEIVQAAIPTIGEHPPYVIMHNDAVIQGLSQAPFLRDAKHWGVLTMGTGLGNAAFTTKEANGEKD
ncbi:ROK family protein [Rhodoligotrophos defluvii]|uniref:ROK family protein n=1 Tax=Rhodoligotrophos defluvii TaxID=2561934 RepID=UPI0010C95639|nr:ROK family protein [Rhodoligotrophos defluvii]